MSRIISAVDVLFVGGLHANGTDDHGVEGSSVPPKHMRLLFKVMAPRSPSNQDRMTLGYTLQGPALR